MSQEEKIVSFTVSAQQHIESVIAEKPQAKAYRLSVKKTGCNGYMYVSEVVPLMSSSDESDDVILNQAASFPVYIALSAVDIIKGTTIDFMEKSFGMKQLVFHNPNIAGECGCGESFNLKEVNDDNG